MRRIIALSEECAESPLDFLPAFCPNACCTEHSGDRDPQRKQARWFVRNGSYPTEAFGQVPRFRCRRCGRFFSRQSFRLDYYAKRVLDYRLMLQQLVSCTGTRDLCRLQDCSTGTVANRLERLARTQQNRLFAVNYLDRQFRKDLKECVRHTVCYARNVSNLMQRMLLYRMYHNHFKAFRHRDPEPTHAAVAGIDERWVDRRLSQLFAWRAFLSRSMVTPADRSVWLRELQTPLKRRGEYLPRLAAD